MNSKTNLAIIGCGYMGEIYRKAAVELYDRKNIESYYKYDLPGMLTNFRLKAVVDIKFADSSYREGEDLWHLDSIETLIGMKELGVNAAVVSTPIKTHFQIAQKLIRSGISLLIEKPVCETAKEIKELMRLAKKHKVRIMPGLVERYNPVTLDAEEAVAYKMYGSAVSYSFLRAGKKPERVSDSLIIDKLIHDLDLVQCIFGKYRITDMRFRKVKGEVMECTLLTSHRKGLNGRIVSSWLSEEKTREVVIKFERGMIRGDLLSKKIFVDRYKELSKVISGYKNNQIKDQLVDFIAYKNKLIKTLVSMEDALHAAYLLDEITRKVNDDV